ncbi:MAG: hypothetical protein J6X55_05085, partial [Victivallales bacterium]|nr:hypothetical protein [Victivallales bacterium]
ERCRMFGYVLDMAGVDGRDPLDDLVCLRKELDAYEEGLSNRASVLVANKMDMPEAEANLKRLQEAEPNAVIVPVCAELCDNTKELVEILHKSLLALPPEDEEWLNRILARRRHFENEKTDDMDGVTDDFQ